MLNRFASCKYLGNFLLKKPFNHKFNIFEFNQNQLAGIQAIIQFRIYNSFSDKVLNISSNNLDKDSGVFSFIISKLISKKLSFSVNLLGNIVSVNFLFDSFSFQLIFCGNFTLSTAWYDKLFQLLFCIFLFQLIKSFSSFIGSSLNQLGRT
ncbi:MAG: hypothetical protein Q9M94_07710 [Candidatus Gracilibacteria bacterium]|nr:hypothetical protein [Candidatus Gracilibacteria bacterium]